MPTHTDLCKRVAQGRVRLRNRDSEPYRRASEAAYGLVVKMRQRLRRDWRPTVWLAPRSDPSYHTRMTISELAFGPVRTRGRAKREVAAEVVRVLGESDLALLASERGIQSKALTGRLRDRHHALARCLASGMPDFEASAITGYDPSRISVLKRDPTFSALVAHYRDREDSSLATFQDRALELTLSAMSEMQERLETESDPVPLGQLIEIAKFGADRTGNAPVAKSLNVNANVDFGSRLAESRKRVVAARAALAESATPPSGVAATASRSTAGSPDLGDILEVLPSVVPRE